MSNRVRILITLVVLLTVAIVGTITIGEIGKQIDEGDEELQNRAEAVYGKDYRIVRSHACWDYCPMTATTRQQQKQDLLYTLKRNQGWVSKTRLQKNAPGLRLKEILNKLRKRNDIEYRSADGWGETDKYRYIGGADTPDRLSFQRVRQRVHQRLYLLGASMTARDIANDLPVSITRVKIALQRLIDSAAVDDGHVSRGIAFFAPKEYIDTRHGTLPDGLIAQHPAMILLGAVLLGTVLVGVIRRYQTQSSSVAGDSDI